MTMTKNHRADLTGIEGKGHAILLHLFPATLDQSAIEKNCLTIGPENMTGPGYAAGGTIELNLHSFCPFWDLFD
jgi:hypothetical protein